MRCMHKNCSAAHGCKPCKAAYMRAYRKRKPDIFKNIDLKRTFGITLDTYTEMLEQQKGKCAICGISNNSGNVKTNKSIALAVDHCHSTDTIRGLLCGNCNNGLGRFKDSIPLLKAAIDYLNDTHSRTV